MKASPGRTEARILIIVQNLPVPFDRRVWTEATTLRRAGYGVAVICPKKKMYRAGFEVLEGVEIYRYPLPYEADRGVLGYIAEFVYCWLATLALAVKLYARRPFQVIHACNPPDTFFALAWLFRPLGVKFVFDHHDLSPEMYLAKGGRRGGLLHRCLLLLERLTMRHADHLIAVNRSHADVAMGRGAVEAERISIVRSGPSRTWARGVQPDPALRRTGEHLVVYLGEMCAQDGVDLLLRVIQVHQLMFGDETHFILVGGGPDQKRLSQMASDLGLDGVAEFTGRVSDDDLARILASADLCVDPDPPTEWSDLSTMNKMIEYMAFGRPIVAFDLVEHRRTAGDAALYVPGTDVEAFAAAIRELLDDPARRAKMSAYAIERFQSVLAWENAAPTLVACYDRLLPGAGAETRRREAASRRPEPLPVAPKSASAERR